MDTAKRLSLGIFYLLLAYMPLHIFLSTWIGTSLDILDFTKVAKDALLAVGFLLALAASFKQPWFKFLVKDKLAILITAYTALNVVMAIVLPTDQDAEILGLVYNTRFLLFFLYAWLLTGLFDAKRIQKQVALIIFGVAVAVLFFGTLQYTVLPDGIMRHVGYSKENGVLPAFFIDDKPDLERVMSTVRDPNSFGSYIIIIGTMALAVYFKAKDPILKRIGTSIFALSLLCLWFTFSRSAWLGFALAVAVVAATNYGKKAFSSKTVQRAALVVAVGCVLTITGVVAMRDTYIVKNVIFHADESTILEDPNQLRLRFFKESAQKIVQNPVGHGPGTAGLASIRNEKQGTILNENYYLQVAHEVGVLGLILFLTVLTVIGKKLFGMRKSTLALALFASLLGLAFTNLFVHIWSNEVVAYTWWGLAGLAVGGWSSGRFAKQVPPKTPDRA